MRKTNIDTKANRNTFILGVASLLTFIIFFCNSDIAIEYMKKGLKLCATSVIPSLFPFMVISELIVKSSLSYKIGGVLKYPMKSLFGVSEAGGCAFLLGILCGFPIGAKSAISMYDSGAIDKDELERLLCFSNNPGAAFIISTVGISLFGNRRVGLLLYVCIILSSITVGICSNAFLGKTKKEPLHRAYVCAPHKDTVSVFTSAVSSSAISMLTVCAYVVFFSSLVGCISSSLHSLSLPTAICALVFGFFEMTSGVNAATEVKNIELSLILCALFTAWSGFSVHFQIMTICSGRSISFKKYFVAKAIQGLICALFMDISLHFIFPHLISISEDTFTQSRGIMNSQNATLYCFSFFLASIAVITLGVRSKRRI